MDPHEGHRAWTALPGWNDPDGWRPGPCRPCARCWPGLAPLTTFALPSTRMVQPPHWGAAHERKFVFQYRPSWRGAWVIRSGAISGPGESGDGSLAHGLGNPQAPVYLWRSSRAETPTACGAYRMSQAQIDGMRMMARHGPTKEHRVVVVFSKECYDPPRRGADSWPTTPRKSTIPQILVSLGR